MAVRRGVPHPTKEGLYSRAAAYSGKLVTNSRGVLMLSFCWRYLDACRIKTYDRPRLHGDVQIPHLIFFKSKYTFVTSRALRSGRGEKEKYMAISAGHTLGLI